MTHIDSCRKIFDIVPTFRRIHPLEMVWALFRYICDILGIFKPLFFDAVLGSQIWENSICLEQNEPFADPLTKSLLILREGRNLPNTKDIYHHLVLDVDRVKKSASRVNLNQRFLSWSQVRAKIEPSKMLFSKSSILWVKLKLSILSRVDLA